MLISQNGIIIRISCHGISTIGRNTQGVRIMRMKSDDDKVISVGENVHIPKSYHRFAGLLEKLFSEKIKYSIMICLQ